MSEWQGWAIIGMLALQNARAEKDDTSLMKVLKVFQFVCGLAAFLIAAIEYA